MEVPKDLSQLDTNALVYAESRLEDVATANAFKAPDLLAVFNAGYVVAAKARAIVSGQVDRKEADIQALKAVIALERAPKRLQELGLSTTRSPGGSADQRDAVIASDPDYVQAKRELSELVALAEYYRIRAWSLEKAFSAVKAIIGDRSVNPYLSAGGEDRGNGGRVTVPQQHRQPPEAPPTAAPPRPSSSPSAPHGFAAPRYG